MNWVVTDSDNDSASLWYKLERILNQMKQYLTIQDPIWANLFGNFVDYLEFKFELLFVGLNLVRLQKLIDKVEQSVIKRSHFYGQLIWLQLHARELRA